MIHNSQCLHLRNTKGDFTFCKLFFCYVKCQILFQWTHLLKMVAIGFFNHSTNHCISCWHRWISLTHIDTFWPQPLLCNIIRPLRSLLNINCYYFLVLYVYRRIAQKHCYIRLNRISNHIADLQCNAIWIIKPHNRTIVLNTDIELSSLTICKRNNFFLNIFYHYGF